MLQPFSVIMRLSSASISFEGCSLTMKKWLRGGIALCLSAVILAGCSLGFGSNSNENEQPSTLKVMYYDENSFYQEYGMLYSAMYPNVEIEVVNSNQIYNTYMEENDQDYNKAMQAFIEKEQPDVIMIDSSQITPLIENGTLYDLDTFVADASYNAEGLIPGMLDYMKEVGSGKVYAIPTSFYTQVLFYNRDLFDQFNIPYPTDQMTWTEIINLAKQFPTDGDPKERVFGLKMGWSKDLNELVNVMANAEGLKQFDTETLQMTLDTPAWASLVEQADSVLKSDILFFDDMMYNDTTYFDSSGDYYMNEPFFGGRLAMRLEGNYYVNQIEDAQQYAQNPDDVIKNWDIVTAPVGSQSPDSTSYTSYSGLFAINAASTNVDAAWKFISYVTGDEYARVKSKVNYGNLPLRTQYLEKDTERNYGAFYKLKPMANSFVDYNKVPQQFQYEFYNLMQQSLMKVSEGQVTVADALAELQIKGNELLATEVMTQEELEKYWEEQNQGISSPEIMLREAAGEAVTEEVVEEATAE